MAITLLRTKRALSSGAATYPRHDHWQRRLLISLARISFPLTVEGWHNQSALTGPCILAANHGSHLDTVAVLAALPEAARARVRVAAAEDYWYRDHLHRIAVGAL